MGLDGFWGMAMNGFMFGCVVFTLTAHSEVGDHEGYTWHGQTKKGRWQQPRPWP